MSRFDAPTAAAGALDDADRRARTAALACMVGLAVVLGVGRFAFTPLLPLMLADGSIGLKAGGWLASANYAATSSARSVARRCGGARAHGARRAVATVLLTAAMGVGHLLPVWLAVRFVAGVVSAWTFVFVSQWGCAGWPTCMRRSGRVIYAGPGVGIVVTGLIGSALAGQRAASAARFCRAVRGAVGRDLAHVCGHSGARRAVGRRRAAGGRRNRVAPRAPAPPSRGRRLARRAVRHAGLRLHHHRDVPAGDRARRAAGRSPWPDLFWPMFGAALIVGAITAARLPAHWDNRLLLAAGCTAGARHCRRDRVAERGRFLGRRCSACRSPRSRCSRCARRGGCTANGLPG